jgi:hypothetical protein
MARLPHRGDVALVLMLVAAACSQGAPLPSTDKPLELLARRTLSGEKYDPAGLAGKVVVINFWSPG